MKKFIDTIYEKKALIILLVTAVVLLSGFAKYQQKKAELEKEVDSLILDGLTLWFHPTSLQHADGREGEASLKKRIVDQINEEVSSKEKNEAMRFMVEGRAADTGYGSILEIKGECMILVRKGVSPLFGMRTLARRSAMKVNRILEHEFLLKRIDNEEFYGRYIRGN